MGSGVPEYIAECGYCRVLLLRLRAFLVYIFVEPRFFRSASLEKHGRALCPQTATVAVHTSQKKFSEAGQCMSGIEDLCFVVLRFTPLHTCTQPLLLSYSRSLSLSL